MDDKIELQYGITTEELVRSFRRALEDARREIANLRAATTTSRADAAYFLAGGILTNDMMFVFLMRNKELEQERVDLFNDLLKARTEFKEKEK